MIVFANRRLGPAAELLVSAGVAEAMLRATAAAAQPEAAARWEHELVRWLEGRVARPEAATTETPPCHGAERPGLLAGAPRGRLRADGGEAVIDVAEIAWTPEHFDRQRRFLLEAIERAAEASEHARALRRWAQMIEAHPRDSVQFGRRWTSQPGL